MFKVKFIASEEVIGNLKRKGCYPFEIGSKSFEKGTEVIVDDITPFIADPRIPKNKKTGRYLLDSRLDYEETNGDISETENGTI